MADQTQAGEEDEIFMAHGGALGLVVEGLWNKRKEACPGTDW